MYQANEQTIEMTSFGIEGHVIDHSWYHILKKPTKKDPIGKTDTTAVILLADIFYWHKPTQFIDKDSGIHTFGKKFQSDLLQRSYAQIESQFGFSKDQARDSLELLESLGIVERIFRDEIIKGQKYVNIMYLKFNNIKLHALMTEYYESKAELKKRITSSEISDHLLGKNPLPPRKKPTYTETTPKTSPKTSLKDIVPKEDIVFCKDKIEDIGKGQYPLKKDQLSLFEEMKALDLGADEKTLTIVFRKAIKEKGIDFLKQCIHHMRLKIDSGFKFKKERIAFFRNCLSGKQSIVTESCIENKQIAEKFCKDMQWNGVKITDKYFEATDGKISKEIPTLLPKIEFERMLTDLYRLFNPLEETC